MRSFYLHNTTSRYMTVVIAAAITASVLLVSGCGSIELESHWQSADVAIDGVNMEWNEHATYVEDPGVVISVYNDDEYAYLCLMTSNRTVQRQVIMNGLTVWFDNQNDKNKNFGIRFPLGMQEMRGPGRDEEARRPGEPGEDPGGPDIQKLFDELITSQEEFDIIGPAGAGNRRIYDTGSVPIQVKVGRSRATLVYELKVPLRGSEDNFYAVNSNAGDIIGICLESPEMARQALKQRMGGGMGGGGKGGGRGGMSGPRGGAAGGGRDGFERPEPFDVWESVHLADIQ